MLPITAAVTNHDSRPPTNKAVEATTPGPRPPLHSDKLASRLVAWTLTLSPENDLEQFHVQQAVFASVRIEVMQANETCQRHRLAQVANHSGPDWELARKHEAAVLGATLKRNPKRVTAKLRCSSFGRDWLIAEWKHLLFAVPVEGPSSWSEVETSHSLDLLGTAKTLRSAMSTLQAKFQDLHSTRDLIESEIRNLETDQAEASHQNTSLRELQGQGLCLEKDTDLQQLRRYEASAQRHLTKSLTFLAKPKSIVSPGILALITKSKSETVKPKIEPTRIERTPEPESPIKPVVNDKLPTQENRHQRRQRQATARHVAHLKRQLVSSR